MFIITCAVHYNHHADNYIDCAVLLRPYSGLSPGWENPRNVRKSQTNRNYKT